MNSGVDAEVKWAREDFLDAYKYMVLSRAFDERGNELTAEGTPVPHFHSGIGQEALSIVPVRQLRTTDTVIYTHRGYGQMFAKGVPVNEVVLDAYFKAGGTNNGLGGILHVSRPDLGLPGREGIFGTRFGIALGFAMAAMLEDRDDVVICYYGEAAGARGPLYEALNMAVLWKAPLILVAENNGWSVASRTEWLYPQGRMSNVWRGFDIPVEVIDGNDPETVYDASARAIARARRGDGPTVLEGLTYRVDPHSYKDKAVYQPKEEIERWRKKDPVARARDRLVALGIPGSRLAEMEEAARDEVHRALLNAHQARPATWKDGIGGAAR